MTFDHNHVIIVDDSLTIRHQVKLILRKYDINVLEAFGRKSLLHFMSDGHVIIDLFIMDLSLKEDSGMDLMQSIRSNKFYSQTPIIVLTGDSKKDTVLQCSKYNISFYAVKPINSTDLAMKVLTALEDYNNKKRMISNSSNPFVQNYIEPGLDLNQLENDLQETTMSKINKLVHSNPNKFKKR